MKKAKTILAIGLGLTIGLSGMSLVACGGKKDGGGDPWAAAEWERPETTYWVAGGLKGEDKPLQGYPENTVKWGTGTQTGAPEEVAFKQSKSDETKYKVTLNLYVGDQFKIRYEGLDWDEEPGKSKISYDSLDASQQVDGADIGGEEGTGVGGRNFEVYKDGTYELRLDISGDFPVVSYVRTADAPAKPNPATAITGLPAAKTIALNEEFTFTGLSVTPSDADSSTITWTSTDATKVTVDATGKIKGIALTPEGAVNVIATCGLARAICAVTVVSDVIPATAVTIDEAHLPTAPIHVGDTFELTAATTPADSTDTIAWSASAGGVLTVAAATGNAGSATVTAALPGTGTITATAGEVADTTGNVTVLKDMAFVGVSANPSFPGWNPFEKHSDVPADIRFGDPVINAGVTTWTAEHINLYEDTQFKINVIGKGWGESYGFEFIDGTVTGFADTDATAENSNIKVEAAGAGKYTVVVTETPAATDGEDPTVTLAFTREGDADPVAFTHAKVGLRGGLSSFPTEAQNWSATQCEETVQITGTDGTCTISNVSGSTGNEFKAVYQFSTDGATYGAMGYLGAGNLATGVSLPSGLSGTDNIIFDADGQVTITIKVTSSGVATITAITFTPASAE